jgi:membrane fusion protein (multidrug efflux system)
MSEFDLPRPASIGKTRAIGIAGIVLALIAAAFLAGYLPKRHARQALADGIATESHAAPRVEVVLPRIAASDRALVLPASVLPLEETVLYPRANGYVRRWLVDIGDKVTDGQLLAEIDTPELDQELVQARAQLAQAQASAVQARANRDFSKTNLQRYKGLGPSGVASVQEIEQHEAQAAVDEANVTVAEAAIGSQQANVKKLIQLKAFARVVAPYAGVITARNIERGSLVAMGSATPLFKIAIADPVRVFIQVPQDVAPSVHADLVTKVSVREYPGRVFEGKVARTTGALDPASRTMSTEIRVPNPEGRLMTGMYAEVSLTLPAPHRVFDVPATALVNDSHGLRVAVVGSDGKIRMIPIVVERDSGTTVQVASGIGEGDRLVKIASADLSEGKVVEVVQ